MGTQKSLNIGDSASWTISDPTLFYWGLGRLFSCFHYSESSYTNLCKKQFSPNVLLSSSWKCEMVVHKMNLWENVNSIIDYLTVNFIYSLPILRCIFKLKRKQSIQPNPTSGLLTLDSTYEHRGIGKYRDLRNLKGIRDLFLSKLL